MEWMRFFTAFIVFFSVVPTTQAQAPRNRYVEKRVNPAAFDKENPLRILFLGDSITEGGGDDASLRYGGYRGFIQRLFPAYGLNHFRIVGAYESLNYGPDEPLSDLHSGIGGAGWSPDFTYPLGSIVDAWNASKSLKPQLIFVMGGGNGLTLGESVEHDVAAALTLLRQIFVDYPDVCIVLGSHIPAAPTVSFIPGVNLNQQLTEMNAGLKKNVFETLKREGKRIFWADINAAFVKASRRGRLVIGPGGTHPTEEGYRVMSETWLFDSNVFK